MRVLGASRGSPSRALEIEASILPVPLRLEKLCKSYSLRFLRLLQNHPLKTALYGASFRDPLGDTSTEDVPVFKNLQPTTQLLALACRLQPLVPDWLLEGPPTRWETPWDMKIGAEITISDLPKKKAAEAHLQLLERLDPELELDFTAVYYTDGSQAFIPDGTRQNAAAACRIGPKDSVLKAYCWNLGEGLEIADAEVYAIVKVLKIAAAASKTHPKALYIFVDSQPAINKLRGFSDLAQQAKTHCKTLKKHGIAAYV